jgi:hypothetical protein
MTNLLAQEGAIKRCNRKFKTKDCKVYALNAEVIWMKEARTRKKQKQKK